MFAREQKQEYDPTSSPMIERPLATGRPLSVQVQGNAFGGRGLEGFRKENTTGEKSNPLRSPAKADNVMEASSSPSKDQVSPTKSSLSSKSRYSQAQAFVAENGIWSDEEDSVTERQLPPGKSLHRHAKSVTFDAAPPQVNEYEMTTPDPSSVASGSRDGSHDSEEDEEEESFDRGFSLERDDSFDASLEDTDKTPVVLPEDWRFMSPSVVNDDLAAHVEDAFDGDRSSPAPTARPSSAVDAQLSPSRSDSSASNGERRPLPPLPPSMTPKASHVRSDSQNSFAATAERLDQSQRSAASPPRPATVTKSEIQDIGGSSMPIEERLRLMMRDDDPNQKSPDEEQRERRLRRGSSIRSPDPQDSQGQAEFQGAEVDDEIGDLGEYKMPPRISRESILRTVKGRARESEVEEGGDSSFVLASCFSKDISSIDPDTPLPTTEDVDEEDIVIKQEPEDDGSEVDVYSIPDLYSQNVHAESFMNAIEKLQAVKDSREAESQGDDDCESHYSVDSKAAPTQAQQISHSIENDGPPTPLATVPEHSKAQLERNNSHRMSLPQFAALLGDRDFDFGMDSFMADSQPIEQDPVKSIIAPEPSWTPSPPLNQVSSRESPVSAINIERPITPKAQLEPPRFPSERQDSVDEPRTPESVIRHPVGEPPARNSPGIPEPVATIKASGKSLKTRPSATPADVHEMAEVRRQVSGELPPVPKIPERLQSRPSMVVEADDPLPHSATETSLVQSTEEKDGIRQPKRKSSLVPLDIPVEGSDGLGIESEFDRLIEAQKVGYTFSDPDFNPLPWSPGYAEYMAGQGFRPIKDRYANSTIPTQKGYLMRHNTKVVVASSASHESASSETKEEQDPAARETRSAGNSPRKASHTQTWTTEPWNGKARRKSIRKSGGAPSKAPATGPVPPLPGMQSNVASGLDSVNENQTMGNTEDIGEDGERGRLFVKVVRVKDLDLPLPRGMSIIVNDEAISLLTMI